MMRSLALVHVILKDSFLTLAGHPAGAWFVFLKLTMKQTIIALATATAFNLPTSANSLPSYGDGIFVSDCFAIKNGFQFN